MSRTDAGPIAVTPLFTPARCLTATPSTPTCFPFGDALSPGSWPHVTIAAFPPSKGNGVSADSDQHSVGKEVEVDESDEIVGATSTHRRKRPRLAGSDAVDASAWRGRCPWPECKYIITGRGRQRLVTHYRQHTREPEFRCAMCGGTFYSSKRFEKHTANRVCRISKHPLYRIVRGLPPPTSPSEIHSGSAPRDIAAFELWLASISS